MVIAPQPRQYIRYGEAGSGHVDWILLPLQRGTLLALPIESLRTPEMPYTQKSDCCCHY